MYEAAVKKRPKNDELLSHLFMAYVRTEDYKKQQQIALALYKVTPSNPYYSWAVMSIVMQVNDWIKLLYHDFKNSKITSTDLIFFNHTCYLMFRDL